MKCQWSKQDSGKGVGQAIKPLM